MLGEASCGGDDGLSPDDVVGTYTLVSFNGAALPATLPNGDLLMTGALTLHGNHIYGSSEAGRTNGGNGSPYSGTDSGTWEIDGNDVLLSVLNGAARATYQDGVLTVQFFFGAYRYER